MEIKNKRMKTTTLGALKATGYQTKSIKEELRANLIEASVPVIFVILFEPLYMPLIYCFLKRLIERKPSKYERE